jgi:TorA maturation chaperone TorD
MAVLHHSNFMDINFMHNPEEVLTRGNCFKLLAACFCEPDKEMFEEENLCGNLAMLLKPLSPGAATAAETMKISLQYTAQERLSLDYAALFIGPFELIAAPYGSVYLEQNRRIMGDSTIDTQRFYQDAGLALEMKEPADHIAIELEFMYYLCSKEAGALSEGAESEAARFRTLQVEFFEKMMGWVPQFCELIRAGAVTQYYKSLATCLDDYYSFCRQLYKIAPSN